MRAEVVAVSLSPTHTFSKHPQPEIELLAGLGVHGDAHCGSTVRHRYKRRRDPRQPNLTQVHLLQSAFFADLRPLGFHLQPGDLGENITTSGIDLLSLPTSTRLHLGATAVLELTGLRTPCTQMNRLHPGLMAAAFTPDSERGKVPRAGVMAIVLRGGRVAPGCPILAELPPSPRLPLRCV